VIFLVLFLLKDEKQLLTNYIPICFAVIHVDKANNRARREYLKSMLLKPDLHTDRYLLVLKNSIKVLCK